MGVLNFNFLGATTPIIMLSSFSLTQLVPPPLLLLLVLSSSTVMSTVGINTGEEKKPTAMSSSSSFLYWNDNTGDYQIISPGSSVPLIEPDDTLIFEETEQKEHSTVFDALGDNVYLELYDVDSRREYYWDQLSGKTYVERPVDLSWRKVDLAKESDARAEDDLEKGLQADSPFGLSM